MRAFLVSLAFTLAAGFSWITSTQIADAQSSGFPSRPRFQSVGVGVAVPAGSGNLTVSGTVAASNVTGNINGIAASDFARLSQSNNFSQSVNNSVYQTTINTNAGNAAISGLRASNGTNSAYLGITGTAYSAAAFTGGPSGQQVFIGDITGGLPISIGTAGAERVRIAGDGSLINLKSTVVQVNGSTIQSGALQRVAYAYLLGTGAGCSVSGAAASSGITCSRTGVGQYTITLSAGFSTPPVCTASAATSVGYAETGFSTATTAFVSVHAPGGALADGHVSVSCIGS